MALCGRCWTTASICSRPRRRTQPSAPHVRGLSATLPKDGASVNTSTKSWLETVGRKRLAMASREWSSIRLRISTASCATSET